MLSLPARAPRQRGFSLVVVFLIVLVMVGIASAVMFGTQSDLQVSGHEREGAVALYAAEAGVSWAQWWLYRFPSATLGQAAWGGPGGGLLNGAGGPLAVAYCVGPPPAGKPVPPDQLPPPVAAFTYVPGGPTPDAGQRVIFDPARSASFQWCVHNNATDPLFNGAPLPAGCPGPNACDSDNIVTVESYGFGPNGATARLTVDVSYFNPAGGRGPGYAQGGDNELKTGGGRELSPGLGTSTRSF